MVRERECSRDLQNNKIQGLALFSETIPVPPELQNLEMLESIV